MMFDEMMLRQSRGSGKQARKYLHVSARQDKPCMLTCGEEEREGAGHFTLHSRRQPAANNRPPSLSAIVEVDDILDRPPRSPTTIARVAAEEQSVHLIADQLF